MDSIYTIRYFYNKEHSFQGLWLFLSPNLTRRKPVLFAKLELQSFTFIQTQVHLEYFYLSILLVCRY